MDTLNDEFLAAAGLEGLEPRVKRSLLHAVRDELELRVGRRLSAGLDDDALEEFSRIIDRRHDVIERWIALHRPEFREHDAYLRVAATLGADAAAGEVLAEYAATEWLAVNRPDYREIVKAEVEGLRVELSARACSILERTSALAGPPTGSVDAVKPTH
ncbi:DUF5663 domain-containing protein [Microbacterium sp. P5_E9]